MEKNSVLELLMQAKKEGIITEGLNGLEKKGLVRSEVLNEDTTKIYKIVYADKASENVSWFAHRAATNNALETGKCKGIKHAFSGEDQMSTLEFRIDSKKASEEEAYQIVSVALKTLNFFGGIAE